MHIGLTLGGGAGHSFIRFSKHQELVALGREAAEQNLPYLLDEVRQKQRMPD